MEQYYSKDIDFFSLFEATTFDVENMDAGGFKGYVIRDGVQVLAGTFAYDSTGMGGWGWWNEDVI